MSILYSIEFLVFILAVFYPLGKIGTIILRLKKTWENFFISINIGIIFFTLFTFILWRLNFQKFTFLLILIPIIYTFSFSGKNILLQLLELNFLKITLPKVNPFLIFIILFSTLIQSFIFFQAGDIKGGGMKLPNAFGVDGMSYIALVNSIQKSIPPQNPSFSGVLVQNYHYLNYVFVAGVQSLTKIPLLFLNFKLITTLFIFLFSITLYIFFKKITNSSFLSCLGILFVTLSSNLFYLVNLFYKDALISPSVLWVDEFLTRLVNSQLILSYIIILTILYLLLIYKKIDEWRFAIPTSILVASLIGIKSFSSIIFLGSFSIFILFKAISKDYGYIKFFLLSIVFTLFIYFSSNTFYTSLLIISPFWFIKNIFETKDHLNFVTWELKRQTYLKEGNFLRIFQLYLEGNFVFLIGNLGGRILSIVTFFIKSDDRKNDIIKIINFMGILGLVLPIVFIVKGTVWNSIQFFYYAILAFSILTIIALGKIFEKRKIITLILFSIIWISLIPGVIYSINSYFKGYQHTTVSPKVLEGLNFLEKQEDGIILISPSFYNTALISALSKKEAFFADEMMLNVQLINYQERKQEVNNFFLNDIFNKEGLLKRNNIKYIFASSKESINLNDLTNLKEIFSNDQIIVLEVYD